MESDGACWSSEGFNGMASWLGTSLVSAFFSSMERFSCINLSTSDDIDEYPISLSASSSVNSSVTHSTDVANLPV